jgi:hypothetical protein
MTDVEQTIPNVSEPVPLGVIQHNLANIKPTVAEINHLWTTYIAESMACAFQKHIFAKSKDPDYRQVM